MKASIFFYILKKGTVTSINEIFYQKGGRAQTFMSQDENTVTTNPNCVQVYQTNYSWDSRLFQLDGFYSTGYYYCNYEDNFFGFYPEAHYEPNVEIYNGFAPNGFEVEGKRKSNGLKAVFGSALWRGGVSNTSFRSNKSSILLDLTLLRSQKTFLMMQS